MKAYKSYRASKTEIHKACEYIERNINTYSCSAIGHAIRKTYEWDYGALNLSENTAKSDEAKIDYSKFYEKLPGSIWFEERSDTELHDPWAFQAKLKNQRIIALLFYLEARDDI